MHIVLTLIALFILIIVLVELMFYKSDKDTARYECYYKMNFKGIANVSGCQGTGAPECKHCYYHKLLNKK